MFSYHLLCKIDTCLHNTERNWRHQFPATSPHFHNVKIRAYWKWWLNTMYLQLLAGSTRINNLHGYVLGLCGLSWCVLQVISENRIFHAVFFLQQMFDGWVLKGEKFPSSQDHLLPLHQRYTDYCSSTATGATSRSSQNVAMIFFRIHSPDSGFTLAVKKQHNPFREWLLHIFEVS